MRIALVLAGMVLLLAPATLAKDPPSYEKGLLLSMESVSCGYAQNGGKSVTGELLGTDSGKTKTQELLCQEYSMQTDRLIYRIRPKDDKHPALLPVGETVQFRIHKDMMYLRAPESDNKEREYTVISMQLRQGVKDSKLAQ